MRKRLTLMEKSPFLKISRNGPSQAKHRVNHGFEANGIIVSRFPKMINRDTTVGHFPKSSEDQAAFPSAVILSKKHLTRTSTFCCRFLKKN